MQACSKYNVELLVFDRPNPNGEYIDGPVLKKSFSSFVGVDEIPVVHGLTVGEYAKMVQGEKWILGAEKLKLNVMILIALMLYLMLLSPMLLSLHQLDLKA